MSTVAVCDECGEVDIKTSFCSGCSDAAGAVRDWLQDRKFKSTTPLSEDVEREINQLADDLERA